ncbi:ferredoxin--NADP reductase [Sphingosinicella sp. LY1275]|uniref:ferredoxin--NADP reductase n=1 Tax=Sphingosinicella sp. LY1275 TaxID=3095379 RepID=UPI002ADEE32A|nr:ferredoxin--NADP reductase [Sphingosinicella sp. LY1275]MEA1014506.1 ferredoxin--NADP reductase [Sphingosinicella sp. LY1275]
MASVRSEKVLSVEHWSDTLFSFTTTRDPSFRFESGHFVMLGIDLGGKKLMRAYSIASPHYDDKLEFLSIKVPDGALTSKLQLIQPGQEVLVSDKPVGTLVVRDLKPAKNLYLFSTGTGLAPFMSIIQDPETYEKFEKVVLLHGVRTKAELAYRDFITNELPNHEFLGEMIANQLIYYPSVTREEFENRGRITDHINSGKLAADTGLPPLNPETDRAMICGGPAMLSELSAMLDARGFTISPGVGELGDYVIERAFVEK